MARREGHSNRNKVNNRYFSVYEPDETGPRNFMEQLVESYIDAAEQRDNDHILEMNRVKDTMSLVTKTPWLRHTKWEERFIGKDMDALNKLADTPDVKNYNERRIWDQVGE